MAKQEGTVQLGGLFEGTFRPDQLSSLQSWHRRAQNAGLELELATDGNMFSLMPRNEAYNRWRGSLPLEETIEPALNALLDELGDENGRSCMCTLRSAEVLPGKERQSIYLIGPDRRMSAEQRTVDAQTVPPPEPLDTSKLMKQIGIGAASLVVLIAISTFFVPYKKWFSSVSTNVTVVKGEDIHCDLGDYATLLKVNKVEWHRGKGVYHVYMDPTLKLNRQELQSQWTQSTNVFERLAVESLVRRRLTVESINNEGQVLRRDVVELLDVPRPKKKDGEPSPGQLVVRLKPSPAVEVLRFRL